MAITVLSGFNIKGASPIDTRLVLSKSEMLNINDNLMPETYFAVCTNDDQLYLYNKYAEPNAETGKFQLLGKDVIDRVSVLEDDVVELHQDVDNVDEKVDEIKTMTYQEIEDIINN